MSDKPEKKITPPVVAPEIAPDVATNGLTTLTEAELDAVSGGLRGGNGGIAGNGGSISFD